MENLKNHIVFKFLAIALVISIAIPSVIKFSHIFADHKHEVCLGETSTHLHELDLECEFYKFKLNNNFTLPQRFVVAFINNEQSTVVTSQYLFLSNYQRLHFSLRGPPVSI